MARRFATLLGEASYFCKTEGLVQLLIKAPRCLFLYTTLYLYEQPTEVGNKVDLGPGFENLTFKRVSSTKEADELVAAGFDFPASFLWIRRNLEKGAIAFSIFVQKKLVHLFWLAMTEEAQDAFQPFPYHVDFSNREACAGGAVTIPNYREKGLLTYANVELRRYLKGKGIETLRYTANVKCLGTQRMGAKGGARIYARVRYLRILQWKWWKEEPLAHTFGEES